MLPNYIIRQGFARFFFFSFSLPSPVFKFLRALIYARPISAAQTRAYRVIDKARKACCHGMGMSPVNPVSDDPEKQHRLQ